MSKDKLISALMEIALSDSDASKKALVAIAMKALKWREGRLKGG